MKPWTEDDFLEKLMPHLRRDSRVLTQSCPDSNLLAAFTEDQVTPFVRDAVTTHLAECRECSEISARLVSFAKARTLPPAPQSAAEWVNTEKRLGNWMEGFLRDNAAKAEATSARADSRALSSAWKLWGAVGAVAVVVLATGGIFFVRQRQVDRASLPPIHVSLPPTPVQSVTPTPQTPAHAPDLVPPSAVKHPATSPKPAHESKPRTVFPAAPVVASAEAAKPAPVQTAPVPRADAANTSGSQDAHSFSPPDFHPNDRIVASGSAPPAAPKTDAAISHASILSSSSLPREASSGSRLAAPKVPSTETPQLVRLGSGTRLWVRMSSTDRRADGSFSFRGSLQQPVNQSGKVTLDRDAEVGGSGSVRNGKIAVMLERVVIRGVSYKLKNTSGTIGAKRPGAATAVEFDGGKVQELWLGAAAVYEKEPQIRPED